MNNSKVFLSSSLGKENKFFFKVQNSRKSFFLFAILILALSIGIFLLMHKKEKPVLFYRVMIGYSVFLLAVFIISFE